MAKINPEAFPIGIYTAPDTITGEHLINWINDIEEFPKRLRELVQDLSEESLMWQYREGSWSIAQLVHHCADSHINSWCRFRLALTEDHPAIRPYDEKLWAQLPLSDDPDIEDSLLLLGALHRRWAKFLRQLTAQDRARTYFHPEHGDTFTVGETIGSYAWHSNHHLAHVKQAIARKGKFNG